jgi:LysM repeat protein
MKTSLAELGIGIGTALLSVLLVTGALLMSLAEVLPTSSQTILPSPTLQETRAGGATLFVQSPPTRTSTPACRIPTGWISYTIQAGDTLDSLAAAYGMPVDQIASSNCLGEQKSLWPGTTLNLPPLPSPTSTITLSPTSPNVPAAPLLPSPTLQPVGCPIPPGWIRYRIRPGDNLYQIGLLYNTTASQLAMGNCLGDNDHIIAGNFIYVPNVVTSTPRQTATYTPAPPKPTSRPTSTNPPPTSTFTNTPAPPPTATPDTPTATLPTSTPDTPSPYPPPPAP